MTKILIVDDDVSLCASITQTLADYGYVVDQTHSAVDAKALLDGFTYDIILLDWMMPEMTGIEFLSNLRLAGNPTPVIMLTGMNSTEHKEGGLDSGADDYLTKPFQIRELVARIRAVLRRPQAMKDASITLSGITIDTRCSAVRIGQEEIKVTRQEFLLLEYLMLNPNQAFSHEFLVERAWSSLSESSPDTVRVHMSRLRKKLGKVCPIETVHGIGYKFVTQ
ncbi:MAG: response regulator transcription factor [Candidatus Obscuribacterales bacterium]|nr:response regulator transcription factor [Candidatus Obscuribacterales bacterium]